MPSRSPDWVHPLFQEGGLEEYRRRLLRLAGWIYLFSLGLILLVSWLLPAARVDWPIVYAVIATGILGAFSLWFIPWPRCHPNWLLSIVALCAVQLSVLLVATGSDDSPFSPLYIFVIILSGAYFTGMVNVAAVSLIVVSSFAYHFFSDPVRFDLAEHLLSVPVYVLSALIANFLFMDLQRLSARAQIHARQMELIHRSSRLIHSEYTSEYLFKKFLELAREATGARYAAIRTFDETGAPAAFFHDGLTEAERSRLREPPADTGLLGAITVSDPPVRLSDLTLDPRHTGFPPGHPVMKSLLGVPISYQGRLIGKIYLTEKSGGQSFTMDDESFMVILAEDAAIAIEKTRLIERIQVMAVTDGLTGLFNSRTFHEKLKNVLNAAKRYEHHSSLVLVDVDDFKDINDSHGHPTGDLALRLVADKIRRVVRNVDIPALYGGDEFAVLLPETNKKGALVFAERLRASIADLSSKTPDGREVKLSVSIGVATYPTDAESSSMLIKKADDALYRAKQLGRNRVEF